MVTTRFCLGLLAGALLASVLGPGSGGGLLQLPAASHLDGATVQAACLALLAIVVASGRRWMGRRPGGDLLAGAAAGHLLRGLVLYGPLARSFGLTLVALSLALGLVMSRRSPVRVPEEVEEGWLRRAPGLVLAGAGIAVALEALSRHVSRLGAGEPGDHWVTGSVGLLAAAFGGLAFGRFLRTGARDRAGSGLVVQAAAGCAIAMAISLWVLARIGSVAGFDRFVRGFGLDSSQAGTLLVDVLVALQVLVAPALLGGTALYAAARRREELALLLTGLAAGPLIVDWRLRPQGTDWLPEQLLASSELVCEGMLIAGVGCCLAWLSLRQSTVTKVTGLLAPAGAVALGLLLPVEPLHITHPWERYPGRAELALELPEGLLVAYRDHLTLDHADITPRPEHVELDSAQLLRSLQVVGAPGRERPLRLLLVGQLTPERAATLFLRGGVPLESVDRCASWWRAMPLLEARLFGLAERPPGEVLPPEMATRRLAAGDYDLVIVPAVAGQWTHSPALELPLGTRAVVWQPCSASLDGQELDRVLLAAGDLERLVIGTVHGLEEELLASMETFPVGPARLGRSTWGRMAARPVERVLEDQASLAARLGRDSRRWGPPGDLARGLDLHFAAQRPSSPFEEYPQTVELDEGALALWSRDLRQRTDPHATDPRSFTRFWWSALSGALVGKREVSWILDHLAPIVEELGWERWPELDLAVAYAEREALQPARAAERLQRQQGRRPESLEITLELAAAQAEAGLHAEAASSWKRILFRDPRHPRARRELAAQLLLAGDERGRSLAEEWLAEDPEDAELRALLEAGPTPLQEPGFDPGSGAHEHDQGPK